MIQINEQRVQRGRGTIYIVVHGTTAMRVINRRDVMYLLKKLEESSNEECKKDVMFLEAVFEGVYKLALSKNPREILIYFRKEVFCQEPDIRIKNKKIQKALEGLLNQ